MVNKANLINFNDKVINFTLNNGNAVIYDIHKDSDVSEFINLISSYDFGNFVDFNIERIEDFDRSKKNLNTINALSVIFKKRGFNMDELTEKVLIQIRNIKKKYILETMKNCLSIDGLTDAYIECNKKLNEIIESINDEIERKNLIKENDSKKKFNNGLSESLNNKESESYVSAVDGINNNDLYLYANATEKPYNINMDVLDSNTRDKSNENKILRDISFLAGIFNINLSSVNKKNIHKAYPLFMSKERISLFNDKSYIYPSIKDSILAKLKNNIHIYFVPLLKEFYDQYLISNRIGSYNSFQSLTEWFSGINPNQFPYNYETKRNSGIYLDILVKVLNSIGDKINKLPTNIDRKIIDDIKKNNKNIKVNEIDNAFNEYMIDRIILGDVNKTEKIIEDKVFDWWQKEIIVIIDKGRSVIVEGPTSGGKTTVATNSLTQVIIQKQKNENDTGKIIFIAPTHQLAIQIYSKTSLTFDGTGRRPKASIALLTESVSYVPNDWTIAIGTPHNLNIFLSKFKGNVDNELTESLDSTKEKFLSCMNEKIELSHIFADEIHTLSTTYENNEEGNIRSCAMASIFSSATDKTVFVGLSATIADIDSLKNKISSLTSIPNNIIDVVEYKTYDVGQKTKPSKEYIDKGNYVLPEHVSLYLDRKGKFSLMKRNEDVNPGYQDLSPNSIGNLFKIIREIYLSYREFLPTAAFTGTDEEVLESYIALITYMKDKAKIECRDWFKLHNLSIDIIEEYQSKYNNIEEKKNNISGDTEKSYELRSNEEAKLDELNKETEKKLLDIFSRQFKTSFNEMTKDSTDEDFAEDQVLDLFKYYPFTDKSQRECNKILSDFLTRIGIDKNTFISKTYADIDDDSDDDSDDSDSDDDSDDDSDEIVSRDVEKNFENYLKKNKKTHECLLNEQCTSMILNYINKRDKWIYNGICAGFPHSLSFTFSSVDNDLFKYKEDVKNKQLKYNDSDESFYNTRTLKKEGDDRQWVKLTKKQNIGNTDYVSIIKDGVNMGIAIITNIIPFGIECEITEKLSKKPDVNRGGPTIIFCGYGMSMGINYQLGSTLIYRNKKTSIGNSQYRQIRGRSGRRGTDFKFACTFLANINNLSNLKNGNEDIADYNHTNKGLYFEKNLIDELQRVYKLFNDNKENIINCYNDITLLRDINVKNIINIFYELQDNISSYRKLKSMFKEMQGRTRFSDAFKSKFRYRNTDREMNIYSVLYYIAQYAEFNN